jgi:hypothetical protein
MKTTKRTLLAIATIIGIVIIGCKEDEPDPPPPETQIQRVFTDLTLVRGKSITLIDETGGTTDLKAQGIWQKFNEAFGKIGFSTAGNTKFDTIYENGGHITIKVVVSGTNEQGYAVNGHEIKLSLSFVNSFNPLDLGGEISDFIELIM